MGRLAVRSLCSVLNYSPNVHDRSVYGTKHRPQHATFLLFDPLTMCTIDRGHPIAPMWQRLCDSWVHEHIVIEWHPKYEYHRHCQRLRYVGTMHSNDMVPNLGNWSTFCGQSLAFQWLYPYPDPKFEFRRSYTNSPISCHPVTKTRTAPIVCGRCMCTMVFRWLNPTIELLYHPNHWPIVVHLGWTVSIRLLQRDRALNLCIALPIVLQTQLVADTQYWSRLHGRTFWNPMPFRAIVWPLCRR